jgi:oligoendopeptidase F
MSQSVTEVKKKIDKLLERQDVPMQDRWNVEALYASWEEWDKDLKIWARPDSSPHWPEFNDFKGKLSDPKKLFELLEKSCLFDRHLSKLYTYAHLRHDEDVASEIPNTNYTRMVSYLYSFKEELSWVEPELLQLSDSTIEILLSSSVLEPYRLHVEKILRFKPHTLSQEMERLMALSGKALETAQRAFGVFNNADIKFAPAVDQKGNSHEMSHGKYHLYLRSQDRDLRRTAFQSLHKSFLSYENTLCELIQGQVQRHVFEKRARGYSSCLEAALFPHQIDQSVYRSLISNVHQNLHSLHKYARLRKKLLGYNELHLYDIYVPIVAEVNLNMDYTQAEQVVIESVHPLGKEYQEILRKGLTVDRWVDRFENARKRSGAYSSGCYDSSPYILMNFHGTLNDVLTLTHEAGHSMHTFMSCKHQPYQYSQYPIFLAEVASTFHEELLLKHLLEKVSSKEEKAFLINQKIDDIRATFFRQTLFAEFELKLHEWVENEVPLTPSLLKQEYRLLNQKYYGPDLIVDEDIDIEWARIPHFYYNFYVYQYATGLSASCALSQKVLREGESARKKYIDFLSAGSSAFPIEILVNAGVDMRSSEPVKALIQRFDQLVDELELLLS